MVEGHGDYVPNLHDTPSASWTELISQIDGKLPEIETKTVVRKHLPAPQRDVLLPEI